MRRVETFSAMRREAPSEHRYSSTEGACGVSQQIGQKVQCLRMLVLHRPCTAGHYVGHPSGIQRLQGLTHRWLGNLYGAKVSWLLAFTSGQSLQL